jgi:hypothetical protein
VVSMTVTDRRAISADVAAFAELAEVKLPQAGVREVLHMQLLTLQGCSSLLGKGRPLALSPPVPVPNGHLGSKAADS